MKISDIQYDMATRLRQIPPPRFAGTLDVSRDVLEKPGLKEIPCSEDTE